MITLLPNPEQYQVVDSIVDVLKSRCAVERLRDRDAPPGAAEQADWPLYAEQGWFGLGLPESAGGIGCSVAEEVLAFREMGRFIVSSTVLGTSLGAHLALLAGRPDLSRAMAAGTEKVALALPAGPAGTHRISPEQVGGEFQVIDRMDAKLALVWGHEGAALIPVESIRDITKVDAIDTTQLLERGTAMAVVPLAHFADGAFEFRQRAWLLLSATLVGMSEASRDMAAEYAKVREQFGKPIGSFQAVGHHCANMALRSDAAWVQVKFAALSLKDDRSDAALQVSSSFLLAAEAASLNATMAIRVHGATGFTADCPVHHYLKRSVLLKAAAGGVHWHAQRIVEQPTAV